MKYNVVGLMSGTSLDGLDIAYCEFSKDNDWKFKLIHAETITYDDNWKEKLKNIHSVNAEKISEADAAYGKFLGQMVQVFCKKNSLQPDFISSHGHTIFHQPQNGFTKQLGSGSNLAAESGFIVVNDFRSLDVALGGQGAPLVPVGDKLLFAEMDICLNLGGIANISFNDNEERYAYDVCACNMVLNFLANQKNLEYDVNGKLASQGKINKEFLEKLDKLFYYSKPYPKSLGREDVEKEIIPLLKEAGLSVEDSSATFCNHVARQISLSIKKIKSKNKMLITGGGAFHPYLINCIKKECDADVIVPEKSLIEFKEAIVFAFLGVLRMRGEINCLKSVTGARKDNCGGAIYYP
jgi:anhydro-N-acetylmuramic acid kinase